MPRKMDSWIAIIAVLISVNVLAAAVPFLSYCYSPYPNYPVLVYDWTGD